MESSPNTPIPVMHKSAVPQDGIHQHAFMFKNSPGTKSPGVHKTVQSAEDLVSVTVRKETPSQKAGISLVERMDGIFITQVDESGLFHGSEVEEGDKVLSINGKRLKKGEGVKHIIKTITKAKATVTMVVKKPGISPSRGSRGGKIKKKPTKIFKKDMYRKEDLSLDPDHDPRKLREETNDFDQIRIKATKIYREQPLGLSMVEHKNMIFVSEISLESPFLDSSLQIGDRIVGVGSMNFMTYADAALAQKMAEKAPKEVELVVEKGHRDIPQEVKERIDEIALLKSPSNGDSSQRELELDDLITPEPKNKRLNSSYSGPFTMQMQREDELDREVPQTPSLPFNNSFNVSSHSTSANPKQSGGIKEIGGQPDESSSDDDENNAPIDLAGRVLARQANTGQVNSLATAGHNSWSHADQGKDSSHGKNRKGKRPSSPNKSKFVKSSSQPTTKLVQGKSNRLPLDDTSDESSLDEEIEKSLSTLKKKANLHNSWSHPDKAKSPIPAEQTKKGKRRAVGTTVKMIKKEATKPLKSKPKLKPVVIDDDNDSSSMDEDLEAAAVDILSPERKAKYINNMSFNKSISQMNPQDYDGDIIRIKVQKHSESEPGIKVRKTAGIFILTSLPKHEKRINIGSQVLAINGVMNINTVAKAETLINQTKRFVTLMVDYSSPLDKQRNCRCCGDLIYPNGEHAHPKDVAANDDSGLFTPKVNNHSDHRPKTLLPSKYNVDDYNSETDDDGDDEEGRPLERTHTSKFQPGDKFMIRVKTKGNPGLSLFDFNGAIYVAKVVKGGAFYSTPIDTGDRLISMNGKKMEVIKTSSNAMTMLEEKETVSLYVCRSEKTSAEYKEAVKRRK
ncbi:PDZ domain containing protein [Nitzschia inconspicua]|uniref:PDZ domain containing protein n=1 Tax=Nitzschia inconspicua TaxID=303405 RepID=A0A9K3PQ78_9STRA|nr:PDZ domain containing protein [Nitzschia inconspicua]